MHLYSYELDVLLKVRIMTEQKKLLSSLASLKSACSNRSKTILPGYYEPRDIDVMCGRGRGYFEHQGNLKLRAIVHATVHNYLRAKTKAEKSRAVLSVVETMRASGTLFVKWDDKLQRWYDIGNQEARTKVGHAIRDHLVNMKQCSTKQKSFERCDGSSEVDYAAVRQINRESQNLKCEGESYTLRTQLQLGDIFMESPFRNRTDSNDSMSTLSSPMNIDDILEQDFTIHLIKSPFQTCSDSGDSWTTLSSQMNIEDIFEQDFAIHRRFCNNQPGADNTKDSKVEIAQVSILQKPNEVHQRIGVHEPSSDMPNWSQIFPLDMLEMI